MQRRGFLAGLTGIAFLGGFRFKQRQPEESGIEAELRRQEGQFLKEGNPNNVGYSSATIFVFYGDRDRERVSAFLDREGVLHVRGLKIYDH